MTSESTQYNDDERHLLLDPSLPVVEYPRKSDANKGICRCSTACTRRHSELQYLVYKGCVNVVKYVLTSIPKGVTSSNSIFIFLDTIRQMGLVQCMEYFTLMTKRRPLGRVYGAFELLVQ